MRTMLQVANQRSYPIVAAIVFVLLAWLLARNGVTAVDVVILAVFLGGALAVWFALVSAPSEGMDSEQAVRHALSNGQTPTVIEFYSRYCMGCMAMKPVVDQLENEAGDRLRIVRLDVHNEPGQSLMAEYGVAFTPTFVLVDRNGSKVMESVGMLDRDRVLRELESV